MKVLALLFALIVLLESTVQAACIDAVPTEEHTCCTDEDGTNTGAAENNCDWRCNPFQHCGCCKGTDTLGKIPSLSAWVFLKVIPDSTTFHKEMVPDDIRRSPKRPPKLA